MISRKEKFIVVVVCTIVLILGALSGNETQSNVLTLSEEMYAQTIIPSIKLVGRVVISGIVTIVTLLALRRSKVRKRT